MASCISCAPDGLTSIERERLAALHISAPQASATNAVADDDNAAALGHALFFDGALSGPLDIGNEIDSSALGPQGLQGVVACASCHDPARGGADVRSKGGTSLGVAFTDRHAPTVINAALSTWQFWDGRKDSLWSQALGPLESGVEHDTSRLHVAQQIYARHRDAYERVFGAMPKVDDTARFFDTSPDAVTPPDPSRASRGRPGDDVYEALDTDAQSEVDTIFANAGKAIEAYERRLVDVSSPFDRFLDGDSEALSPSAIRGARLFVGRASCDECHSGPALADGTFRNHGIAQVGAHVRNTDLGRVQGIVGVLADPFNGAGSFSDDPEVGGELLADLAASQTDVGAFKVPTLRNVSQTAPYMHTGAVATLWDVVELYKEAANTDGFAGEKDAVVQPLDLSDDDIADLVAFLQSLDGEGIDAALLVAP